MKRTRRLFVAVACVALVLATVGIGAAWAHQTQGSPAGDGDCDSEELCLWSLSNEGGSFASYIGSDSTYGGNTYLTSTLSLNDTVSSLRNDGDTCAVFIYQHRYQDADDGWAFVIDNTNMTVNMSDLGANVDNNLSSHHWCSGV